MTKTVEGQVVEEDSQRSRKELERQLKEQIELGDDESDLEDSGDFMEKLRVIADKKGEGDDEEEMAAKNELKELLENDEVLQAIQFEEESVL